MRHVTCSENGIETVEHVFETFTRGLARRWGKNAAKIFDFSQAIEGLNPAVHTRDLILQDTVSWSCA
jgi:hypothetical protein